MIETMEPLHWAAQKPDNFEKFRKLFLNDWILVSWWAGTYCTRCMVKRMPSDVRRITHSTIRIHWILSKLQQATGLKPWLQLQLETNHFNFGNFSTSVENSRSVNWCAELHLHCHFLFSSSQENTRDSWYFQQILPGSLCLPGLLKILIWNYLTVATLLVQITFVRFLWYADIIGLFDSRNSLRKFQFLVKKQQHR